MSYETKHGGWSAERSYIPHEITDTCVIRDLALFTSQGENFRFEKFVVF